MTRKPHHQLFKYVTFSAMWLWMLGLVLLPLVIILVTSFLSHDNTHLFRLPFSIENYQGLLNNAYIHIFLRSLIIAAICTVLCLLFGYPFAYLLLNHVPKRYRSLLVVLVMIPFWTSSLVRSYAIMTILNASGLLNNLLRALGLIHSPIQFLYTNIAVFIGLTYSLLPFMILPLYANLEKIDSRLIEAARDLGATWFTIFRRILLPLTRPGILAGTIMVFLPAMTLFYIPVVLGGAKSMLLGNLIQDEFLSIMDWPLGSASSIVLIALLGLMLLVYWRYGQKSTEQGKRH